MAEASVIETTIDRLGAQGDGVAASMFMLIETDKPNGIDPQVWLADILRRINHQPVSRLGELLPWNWKARPATLAA